MALTSKDSSPDDEEEAKASPDRSDEDDASKANARDDHGAAEERAVDGDEAGDGSKASQPPEPDVATGESPRRPGRGLRYLFYAVWIAGMPLALALFVVWVLSPSPDSGPVGGLRELVEQQRIPVVIALITVFATILWRFRHDLPLAGALGVGRREIPPKLRGRFEDALTLIDDAERIRRTNKKELEKELTRAERELLDSSLRDLAKQVATRPFDPPKFEAAHTRAERLVGEHLARWRKGEIREYAESIAIAIGVAMLLRVALVEPFKIPSGSMIPTLMIGDHIFVNKFAYGPLIPWTNTRVFADLPPDRADVMVFKFPENPDQDFIKRVIATPGDTLEVIDGRPILNGWLVPNCHVGTFDQEGRGFELYLEYLRNRAYLTLFESAPTTSACASTNDCGHGLSCRAGVCGSPQGPFRVKENEVWVMGDNRNNSHDSRSWRGGLGAGVPFENIKGRAMFVFATFGPGTSMGDRFLVDVMGRPQVPKSQSHLQAGIDRCMKQIPKETNPPPPSAKR
jgi:signal peptidase I